MTQQGVQLFGVSLDLSSLSLLEVVNFLPLTNVYISLANQQKLN